MKLRYTLPAIVWTIAVLLASSDFFSATHTGSWLRGIFEHLLGQTLPSPQIDWLNFLWRKSAHCIAYGILSALWFRALRADAKERWVAQWAWTAILIAAAVAVTDEIHQSFVPSRSGSPYDVMLDTTSAALVQGLIRAAQVLIFRA